MTDERREFGRRVTRFMREGSRVFLLLWLFVCAAIASIAVCAIFGNPDGVNYSGSPAIWTAALLGAFGFALLGAWFVRFWQQTLERVSNFNLGPDDPSISTTPVGEHRYGISTSTHVGLQFVLTFFGGVAGLLVFSMCFWKSMDSQLKSMVILALTVSSFAAVPRLLMFLVPARCPNCSGKAYCRGSRPIVFVCCECSHTHNTGMSFGSGED